VARYVNFFYPTVVFINNRLIIAKNPFITDEEEGTMGRTSNDDRSDSMNPNNQAYWDSLDNQSDQLNPNNERYQGSNDRDDDDDNDNDNDK